MTRRMRVLATLIAAASVGLAVGCTTGTTPVAEGADAVADTSTEPPTTTVSVTTVAPTTVAPTTVPPEAPPTTSVPKATTTTLDEATKRFYEAFGGPRVPGTPLPDPYVTSGQGKCSVVPGGFGVDSLAEWSDGFKEMLVAPGPFTASAQHVVSGSRGSTVDITVDGVTCLAQVNRPYD